LERVAFKTQASRDKQTPNLDLEGLGLSTEQDSGAAYAGLYDIKFVPRDRSGGKSGFKGCGKDLVNFAVNTSWLGSTITNKSVQTSRKFPSSQVSTARNRTPNESGLAGPFKEILKSIGSTFEN